MGCLNVCDDEEDEDVVAISGRDGQGDPDMINASAQTRAWTISPQPEDKKNTIMYIEH